MKYTLPFSVYHRGRGAVISPANRYSKNRAGDLYEDLPTEEINPAPKTQLLPDQTKSIITYNDSPDIPFDRSVNVYRGCEHGCVYCYARPGHAWLGYSPGLDFETVIFYKKNAAELLARELSAKKYRCAPIALGSFTDSYQPAERELKLTRQLLEVMAAFQHPSGLVTKSALIERDLDILAVLAEKKLIHVMVTVTSLNNKTASLLEPRAAAPQIRLKTLKKLREAGIPAGVLVAPIIPVLTEHETEMILEAAYDAGAMDAFYVLLRLPLEIAPMFETWVKHHFPKQAEHILNRLRDSREGKLYHADFKSRMTGSGIYADLIYKRFTLKKKKLGFPGLPKYNCSLFRVPSEQSSLFEA